jgi:hypothetical protein
MALFTNIKLVRTITAIVIMSLLFIIPTCVGKHYKNQYNSQAVITALSNELTKTVNKYGQETSQKNVLVMSVSALKSIHASDSSEIGRLQKIVNKKTSSATALSSTTSGTLRGKPHISFKQDTIINYNLVCDTIYPVYKDTLRDQWTNITIEASKDSTVVKYTAYNEYNITQQTKKQGKWPFRKKVAVVTVQNLNPNTKTNGVSSFSVPEPKVGKAVAGGVVSGIVSGIILTLLLLK